MPQNVKNVVAVADLIGQPEEACGMASFITALLSSKNFYFLDLEISTDPTPANKAA